MLRLPKTSGSNIVPTFTLLFDSDRVNQVVILSPSIAVNVHFILRTSNTALTTINGTLSDPRTRI